VLPLPQLGEAVYAGGHDHVAPQCGYQPDQLPALSPPADQDHGLAARVEHQQQAHFSLRFDSAEPLIVSDRGRSSAGSSS
jgi:hypothetical protein